MKTCTKCKFSKDLNSFWKKSGAKDGLNSWCKTCANAIKSSKDCTAWRIRTKEKLVQHFGNKCVDCFFVGPPFMFDFDHRDPSLKSFGIADSLTANYAKLLAEAEKCDLVCANCHRMRTHKQRCQGCQGCKYC